MTTRSATANGLTSAEANYRERIGESFRELDVIFKDIVRKRLAVRRTKARIDRKLKEIQTIIDRVQGDL